MLHPSRRPGKSALIDLCVSGSMVLLATYWWHQFRLGGLVYGCLVGAALMWRRHRPVLAFAGVVLVSAGATPIEVHGSHLHEGMLLTALAAAMYAVVRYASTLVTGVIVGIVAVLAGTGILLARTALFLASLRSGLADAGLPNHLHSIGARDLALDLLLTLTYATGVWAVALIARVRLVHTLHARERAAAAERERAHLAQITIAEERARIARELHDIVAHSLSVMIVHAHGGEYALDRDPERARAALRTISATGQDALGEIKQLVQILRSEGGTASEDRSPVALDQVDAVVARARGAGLAVGLTVDGVPPEVPGGVALAVYRIVQESLTNTLKHAGPAPSATVRVGYRADAIEVDVTDTGSGGPVRPGGHGLVGMRERVALYGGSFDAGPHLGGGWRVRARIPLVDADRMVAV